MIFYILWWWIPIELTKLKTLMMYVYTCEVILLMCFTREDSRTTEQHIYEAVYILRGWIPVHLASIFMKLHIFYEGGFPYTWPDWAVHLWSCKWCFWTNPFRHSRHWKGLTPVCNIVCLLRFCLVLNFCRQTSHWCRFGPPHISWCLSKELALWISLPQYLHLFPCCCLGCHPGIVNFSKNILPDCPKR